MTRHILQELHEPSGQPAVKRQLLTSQGKALKMGSFFVCVFFFWRGGCVVVGSVEFSSRLLNPFHIVLGGFLDFIKPFMPFWSFFAVFVLSFFVGGFKAVVENSELAVKQIRGLGTYWKSRRCQWKEMDETCWNDSIHLPIHYQKKYISKSLDLLVSFLQCYCLHHSNKVLQRSSKRHSPNDEQKYLTKSSMPRSVCRLGRWSQARDLGFSPANKEITEKDPQQTIRKRCFWRFPFKLSGAICYELILAQNLFLNQTILRLRVEKQ